MSTSAEADYLEVLDQIAGGEPRFTLMTAPDELPPIYSVQYHHRPARGSTTCFTVGLSSLPNPGWQDGTGPELAMQIRSLDRYWGCALAELARQGRGRHSFAPKVTVDFADKMSPESEMTAFLFIEPDEFPADPICCLGRHIVLLQAIPIYADERQRIRESGPDWLLAQPLDFSDPSRPSGVDSG